MFFFSHAFLLSVSMTQFQQDSGCLVTNCSPRIPEKCPQRERARGELRTGRWSGLCPLSAFWPPCLHFLVFNCFLCIFLLLSQRFLIPTLNPAWAPAVLVLLLLLKLLSRSKLSRERVKKNKKNPPPAHFPSPFSPSFFSASACQPHHSPCNIMQP